MKVIGREAPPQGRSLRTRTSAMESQEEARQRRIKAREDREAARAEAAQIAEEASYKRADRARGTLSERVERAKQRIGKAPAGSVITILETLSPAEREVYLLAEEQSSRGPQSQVLRFFPPPRAATREAYERELQDSIEAGQGPESLQPEASVSENPDIVPMSGNQDTQEPKKSARKPRAKKTAKSPVSEG